MLSSLGERDRPEATWRRHCPVWASAGKQRRRGAERPTLPSATLPRAEARRRTRARWRVTLAIQDHSSCRAGGWLAFEASSRFLAGRWLALGTELVFALETNSRAHGELYHFVQCKGVHARPGGGHKVDSAEVCRLHGVCDMANRQVSTRRLLTAIAVSFSVTAS